jgi:DNA-binding NarL/FixJ family response regulator
MSIWEHLLRKFGYRKVQQLSFPAEMDVIEAVQRLARKEQRPANQVAADLLGQAMALRRSAEANLEIWKTLTPREQQVAALVCLNYTNRQAGSRLGISSETVKTHVRNLLRKFGLRTKAELRQALFNWDFSAWDR